MSAVAAMAALCLTSTAAQAAVTYKTGDGMLQGASGIAIGGKTYDVTFTDGSCMSLFGDCTSTSFAFRSEATARLAAQALLDQVFVGTYDARPYFINGCKYTEIGCSVYIPFAVAIDLDPDNGDDVVSVTTAFKGGVKGEGKVTTRTFYFQDDMSSSSSTYARFSLSAVSADPVAAVPEPAIWALMLTGFGLTGAAIRRRRRDAAPRVLA
jgi:hypothetical protein